MSCRCGAPAPPSASATARYTAASSPDSSSTRMVVLPGTERWPDAAFGIGGLPVFRTGTRAAAHIGRSPDGLPGRHPADWDSRARSATGSRTEPSLEPPLLV